MTFEDAAHLVHNLSNELVDLVEIKGALAECAQGTTQAKNLEAKMVELSRNIDYLIYQLKHDAFLKIEEELDLGDDLYED